MPTLGKSFMSRLKDLYPQLLRVKMAFAKKYVEPDRPSPSKRGYGREWKKIRDDYLRLHPFCVECGDKAVTVDHIIPLRQHGTNNPGNLQAMCKKCHGRKTVKHDGGLGRARKQRGIE